MIQLFENLDLVEARELRGLILLDLLEGPEQLQSAMPDSINCPE